MAPLRNHTIGLDANGGVVVPPSNVSYTGITVSKPFSRWEFSGSGRFLSPPFPPGTLLNSSPRSGNPIYYTFATGGVGVLTGVYTGRTDPIPLPSALKTGHRFMGRHLHPSDWSYQGTGGEEYSVTGDTTLYAQRDDADYIITYHLSGCMASGEAIIQTGSYTTAALPHTLLDLEPTRAGRGFQGRYENTGFAGPRIYDIPTGSYGDKEFRAKCEVSDLCEELPDLDV
jgi:hypothetical protein